MAELILSVNGQPCTVNVGNDVPLLWVLRDELGLTGTKFGCGRGFCGACTVHLDGVAVRSCMTPAASVGQRRVTTIEGLQPGAVDQLPDVVVAGVGARCPDLHPLRAARPVRDWERLLHSQNSIGARHRFRCRGAWLRFRF